MSRTGSEEAMELKHLDAHMSFRVKEVKAALVRRRRWRCLLEFSLASFFITVLFGLLLHFFKHLAVVRILLSLGFWSLQFLAIWRLLIKPLRQPISFKQTALYIDQHFPELENRLTGMVALANKRRLTWMEQDFLNEARNTVSRSRFGDQWDFTPKPERMAFTSILLFLSLLAWIRFPATWLPWLDEGMTFGGPFSVEPGDAKVRIGDDLIILVKSELKDKAVTLRWKDASGEGWQDTPMKTGDTDSVHFYRFSEVSGNMVYQVLFGPWKSDRFKITAWLPPDVEAIDLTYHYPEYLDMPPREAPNSGLITAPAGAEVVLDIHVNKPLASAEMVFDSGMRLNLKDNGGLVWNTRFKVLHNDVYRIKLTDKDGDSNLFSPSYDISVRPDEPPTIQLSFPNRDMDVSALDEVPFQFKVSDDYGLKGFGLRLEMPDKDPVSIPLHGEGAPGPGASGSYQLALESYDLEPGDLITWTVWAEDRKPDRPEYEQMGPPFFLEVRPFRREFREAVSNNAGAMSAQSSGMDLVTRQKDVLIAAWNLRKKLSKIDGPTFDEEKAILLKAEEEIVAAAQKAMSGARDPRVEDLFEALNDAVAAFDNATWPNPAPELSNATIACQKAYQLLIKLEPPQNRVARANASGSASQSGRRPEEMGELEMDRNRNFYEDEKRTGEEEKAALDALDKLDDLARRQQMINDEIARLISEMREEQTPEQRRRLERLKEELKKNIEKLDEMQRDVAQMNPGDSRETQQQLDKAREKMNRELDNLEQNQLQEARAAGAGAINEMERLEDALKQKTGQSTGERVESLQQELADLNRMQEQIQKRVEALKDEKDTPSLRAGDPKEVHKKELLEEKKALAQRLEDLLENAAQVADQTRSSQELLSRKMGDWLRETSKKGILEEMEKTEEMARFGSWNDLTEQEQEVKQKLAQAAEDFQTVADSLVSNDQQAREKAYRALEQLLNRPEAEPRSDESMQQFVDKDYRQWLDGLANASSWLGNSDQPQRELESAQREIEKFRRDYRQSGKTPTSEVFTEAVVKPLRLTADQLRQEIEAFRKEREFVLRDDGSIPDQYRKHVSEYFQQLSESEGKQ